MKHGTTTRTYSEVVELDDGARVSARAAHLLDQLEAADAELRKMDRTDRRWRIAIVVFGSVVVLVGTYLIAWTNALAQANDQSRGQISQLEGAVSQLKADGNALEMQVRSLGANPVATVAPPSQPGPAGVQGEQGVRGEAGVTPTDDQLRALIAEVIAANPPKDGKTPSADDLLALIKPLIPPPVPGPQGQPGTSPTDQHLLDLIRPLIPTPVPGPPGTPGKDGATGAKGDPGPDCPNGYVATPHQDVDALGNPVGNAYIRCEKTG